MTRATKTETGTTQTEMLTRATETVAFVFKKPESVEELKHFTNGLLAFINKTMGPRSAAVLMIGVPIEDQAHDRFAAHFYGPCLTARGLLAWGEQEALRLIDASDTSKNGKPHP